jgi:hypothetical protein
MILKLKHASSMLSPIVIDHIAEVAPNAGVYYMAPGKAQKWEIHSRLHGQDDGMDAGLILEDDCTFYDGNLEPEKFRVDGEDAGPVRVPIRVLDLTLRDGTKRHVFYATEVFDVFLMSDEGKTIDRLPK